MWLPIAVFVLLNLAVTGLYLAVSSAPSRVGTLRPAGSIPPKLAELAAVGLAVGLVACVPRRKLDLSMVFLALAFVALLDLDHLPALLGVAQPIRPSHSLSFLALEVGSLALVVRRADVVLVAAAGWFAHVAGDTGVFAVFAPFSFSYYRLSEYALPLAAVAVALALLAGHSGRRGEEPTQTSGRAIPSPWP